MSDFDEYASFRSISGLMYSPVPAPDNRKAVDPAAAFASPRSPEKHIAKHKADRKERRRREEKREMRGRENTEEDETRRKSKEHISHEGETDFQTG
jgi:hypothetical protein